MADKSNRELANEALANLRHNPAFRELTHNDRAWLRAWAKQKCSVCEDYFSHCPQHLKLLMDVQKAYVKAYADYLFWLSIS